MSQVFYASHINSHFTQAIHQRNNNAIQQLSSCSIQQTMPHHHPRVTSSSLTDGVSPSTTDEKIREVFSPFGNLREAKVIKDRASGISMGLATVTYDTVEEAERARKRMDYTRFGGYVIFVESEFEFFKQKYEHPPKSFFRVYVDLDDLDEYEGVLDLTTGDKLRAAFAPFGNVLEVRICKGGPYGNSKGTAIIKYGTKEEAEKAHDALEDNLLGHK